MADEVQTLSLDPSCGNLTENTYHRPFDYNASDSEFIRRVEAPHFPPYVEALQRGSTGETPGHDIAYVLRTFPNHPRALMAMSNLARKEKRDKPIKSPFSIQCWMQRAIYFRSEDGMVRYVYGIHLMKTSRITEALEQLLLAEKYLGPNGNLQYNIGLAYFEIKDYDKSLEYAHSAYASGFSLPGLKNKLISKKKWRDPVLAQPASSIDNDGIATR